MEIVDVDSVLLRPGVTRHKRRSRSLQAGSPPKKSRPKKKNCLHLITLVVVSTWARTKPPPLTFTASSALKTGVMQWS